MLETMTTRTKSESERPRPYGDTRPPDEAKRPETFRLPASISEKLEQAAEKFDCSKTYYIELALRNQFAKDGVR
jgi:hypothetical protein